MRTVAATIFLSLAISAAVVLAQSGPHEQRAREIYKELVEINTTDTPAGSVTRAAEAMAARFKAAGFADTDTRVLGPAPNKFNLVLRYRGTGAKRPMLLLAHLDVVDAKRDLRALTSNDRRPSSRIRPRRQTCVPWRVRRRTSLPLPGCR